LNQQQVKKRKESIITAALKLTETPGGWMKITTEKIAIESDCSYGLVAYYFGSIQDIRQTLVRTAIKRGNYAVLAQAMVAGHKMPAGVRAKVIAHISGE
jgi:AcrR family transcriptional regulator